MVDNNLYNESVNEVAIETAWLTIWCSWLMWLMNSCVSNMVDKV